MWHALLNRNQSWHRLQCVKWSAPSERKRNEETIQFISVNHFISCNLGTENRKMKEHEDMKKRKPLEGKCKSLDVKIGQNNYRSRISRRNRSRKTFSLRPAAMIQWAKNIWCFFLFVSGWSGSMKWRNWRRCRAGDRLSCHCRSTHGTHRGTQIHLEWGFCVDSVNSSKLIWFVFNFFTSDLTAFSLHAASESSIDPLFLRNCSRRLTLAFENILLFSNYFTALQFDDFA